MNKKPYLVMYLGDLFRENFRCKRCGNCCRKLSTTLTIDCEKEKSWRDIEVETKEGCFLASDFTKKQENNYDVFYHPETSEKLNQCPFLEKTNDKYSCTIYESRPKKCRDFPFFNQLVDLTKEDICPSVEEIVSDNEKLIEETKMVIFKYFIKHSIEKRN